MKIGDKGIFVRIQKDGKGYNPDHKSYRPPENWKPGEFIDPEEGTLTEGMACTSIDIDELYGMENDDFVVYTERNNPNIMDWSEIPEGKVTCYDLLQQGYEVLVLAGEVIEIIPDGYIIRPISTSEVCPYEWQTKEDEGYGLGLIDYIRC